jgi:hypothetical protein
MSDASHELVGHARVLSLDIRSRRVGYVVFEGRGRLLDWGVIRLRDALVQSLLDTFEPSVIVLRKIARGSIRDRSIVRTASRRIRRKAKLVSIHSVLLSRAQIIRLFRQHVKPTKQEIAGIVAECFPELSCRLPLRRKAWKAEHWNMCLFDSVALGLTFFARHVDAEAVNQLLAISKSFRRPPGGVAK